MNGTSRNTTSDGQNQFPERWTAKRLADVMPGSTRKWWLQHAIPELIRRGAMRKVGQGWIGRRGEIASALMSLGAE